MSQLLTSAIVITPTHKYERVGVLVDEPQPGWVSMVDGRHQIIESIEAELTEISPYQQWQAGDWSIQKSRGCGCSGIIITER